MTTMMKFEFLTDAVMYHGSVRVGGVELFFNDDDYSVNCVGTNGMFPFVYSDSLCRYIALVYWDEFVKGFRKLLENLFNNGLEYVYKLGDIEIRFVGWQVYINGEMIKKPSGIPSVYIGEDVYDVGFIVEELYCGLGFGTLIDIVSKLREFVNSSMEVQR
jgi:hypothetical protein